VILDLITEAQTGGLSLERACQVFALAPRTIQRWRAPAPSSAVEATVPVATTGAGRARPHNALTVSEAAAVVALIRSPRHADASCRELALALLESPESKSISHVTVWHYQRLLNCNGPRGRQVAQGRGRSAPDTAWVDGPNQLWDWDVTYLPTTERGVFFYLYSLLDHWSRKNIAWRVSPRFISLEVQTLWDHGVINEGLLDQPTDCWPKSLSDRGSQMRSQPTRRYFPKLGIGQLFSRPRTPDDNPFIEAHFATIKMHPERSRRTHPVYPGFFVDQTSAEGYFGEFYPWYNDLHPHTRLDMLTPSQKHSGQSARLLSERAAVKAATLAVRRANTESQSFCMETLIANHLPDVSDYPCYSWAGPKIAPAK
jgi:putative transposase